MIHAHILRNMRGAVYCAQCFFDEHQENIEKAVQNPIPIIRLKNGDEHHFMDDEYAKHWCLGRDYMFDGRLYHSDFCVQDNGR